MHQRDLGGEIGEKQRLLDRGIAAADHQHLLAAIEKSIAGGAGGDAIAAEFLLAGQIEPARLRAGRQNQRLGEIDIAGIAVEPKRPARQIDFAHMVGDEPGADMSGLLLHLLHEPGALDHVGIAGIIFDVGGDGELAAGRHALDQDRIKHRAGGIDSRRVARRPGADDHDLGVGGVRHRSISIVAAGANRSCPGAPRSRRAGLRRPEMPPNPRHSAGFGQTPSHFEAM